MEVGGIERNLGSLAELQGWLDNRLISATTPIWVEADGQLVEAQHIPGLTISSAPIPRKRDPEDDRQYLQKVPSYLFLSFVSMLVFCLPVGIVAIVYAAQVDGHLRRGDYESAIESSRTAKTWALSAIGLGLLLCAIVIIRRINS